MSSSTFGSLPQRIMWYELRDHIKKLKGAKITEFLTDHITEAWIDFSYRGYNFTVNDKLGTYWFFVDDPPCPDEILKEILSHCELVLGKSEAERFQLMPTNRSMAPGPVIPELPFADVPAAATWLCNAFGFIERLRIGTHRIQLHVGEGSVVVVEADANAGMSRVMVPVSDVDAHCARARAAGASVLGEPTTYPFGERQYSVVDIGGHRWTFTQTVADSDPATWGGELVIS